MKKNVLATLCAAVLACAIVLPAALQANVAPQAAVSEDAARATAAAAAGNQVTQPDVPGQGDAVIPESAGDGPNDTPYVSGEMLVKLADGVTTEQLNARLANLDYIATKNVAENDVAFNYVKVKLAEGVSVEDASKLVVNDASGVVSAVQPNYIYHMASAVEGDAPYAASGLQAGSIDESALSAQALAGDPLAKDQWGLKAVNAYQAWQLARVDQRVTVAVLDSGVNVNHPDLKDNIVGPFSALNRVTTNVTDVYGHGTHVAGVIAATVDNGIGVAGASYNARIMPVQVADGKGSVSASDFAQGMQKIVEKKEAYNIRVVNISLGTNTESSSDATIMDSIAGAHEAGLLIVYAAGNADPPNGKAYMCLPCDYDTAQGALGVISLQRSGSTYTRSSFSNFNKTDQRTKDISAPGSGILSTTIKEEGEEKAGANYITNPDGSTNYNYGTNSGTSFAAPHVSGIAALLFAAYPGLTAAGVEDILKASATDLYTANNIAGEGQFDLQSGYGLVNAEAALQRAADYFPAQSSTTPSPFISGDNVVAKGSTSEGIGNTPEGIGNTPITLSVINAGTGAWTWEVESGDANVEVTSSGNTSAIVNGKAAGSAVVTARQGSTVLKKTVYVVDPTISGPATITAEKGATAQLAAPDPIVGTWEWALSEDSSVPVSIDQTGKVSVTDDMAMSDAIGAIHVSILLKTDGEESDQGRIKGIYELSFAKKQITDSDVSVPDQPYRDPAVYPTVTVTVGDAQLEQGVDYDVAFEGTYEPSGTMSAIVTGKGNYAGVVTKPFKVLSDFEEKAKVTFTEGASWTYTSSAIEPPIKVEMPSGAGYTELDLNWDYHVYYSNNINAGKGVVTILGDSNRYLGTITAEFTINPFPLTDQNVEVTFPKQEYTGSVLTPEPTVTVKHGSTTKVLKRGTDFTYESSDYSNNINAGTARLKITGKGNYTSSRTDQFNIAKATITKMTLSGGPFTYNGTTQSPKITVTGSNGKTLNPSRDYELVIPAGRRDHGDYTYIATARSNGNYTGTARATMTINRANVNSVTLRPNSFTYNGAVQTPSMITVKGSNGLTLKSNEYSVLYYNSSGAITTAPRLAGTYTAVVTGKGNYTSSARATYTIKAASSGGSSGSGGSGNSGNSGSNNSGSNNSGNNSNSGSNNSGSNNNSSGSNSGNSGGSSGGNANNTITHEGPKRLYGDVALDTMRAIVDEGWSGQTGGTVVLTTLDGYWDALTAAGVAGMAKAPVLMTDTYVLSGQTESIIRTMQPSRIVVCGGRAAVSDDVALAAASASGGARIIRCWGETATGTAVSAFNNASIEGLGRWSSVALVCTNDGYWDALAAAPISYAKRMPIFLTEGRFDISNETIGAMLAGGIRAFYVIGGPAAVDDAVIAKLSGAGIDYADRLSGETAVETSEAVANFGLNWGMGCSNMGVATTNGYWDALAGAPLCGLKNSVLVLAGDSGSHSIAGFVQYHSSQIGTCYVFGGEAALDATTYQAIQYATS